MEACRVEHLAASVAGAVSGIWTGHPQREPFGCIDVFMKRQRVGDDGGCHTDVGHGLSDAGVRAHGSGDQKAVCGKCQEGSRHCLRRRSSGKATPHGEFSRSHVRIIEVDPLPMRTSQYPGPWVTGWVSAGGTTSGAEGWCRMRSGSGELNRIMERAHSLSPCQNATDALANE
jgi:hypothetical protein